MVGHLLGIIPELLPHDLSAAEILSTSIARHQFGSCPEGQALTRALMDSMDYVLPGSLFKHVPALLIRYFLGQQWAAWLGIEESAITELVSVPASLARVRGE